MPSPMSKTSPTPAGSSARGCGEIGDAQPDMLERASLTGAVGVEQRQLPVPGVRADEREVRLVGDDVHAEMAFTKGNDRCAIRHPEGDVIECSGLHPQRR